MGKCSEDPYFAFSYALRCLIDKAFFLIIGYFFISYLNFTMSLEVFCHSL